MLLPSMPKAGIDDLLGVFGIGPYSHSTFSDDPGVQPLLQFSVTNSSATDPLVMHTFDFALNPSFGDPAFIERITGYRLYHDSDGDGEVTDDDYFVGEGTPSGSGDYQFQAQPDAVVLAPLEKFMFLLAVSLQ